MMHLLFRSAPSLALASVLASLAAGAAAQAERLAGSRPPERVLEPALPAPIGAVERDARVDPPPQQIAVESEQAVDPDLGRAASPASVLLPASATADRADLAPSRPSTEPPLVVAPFLSMALSTDRELTVLVEGFGPFYCAVLLADRPDLMHSFFALPPLLATGSIVFTGKAAFGSFVDQMVVPKDVDVSIYGQALIWSAAGLQSSAVAVVDPIE